MILNTASYTTGAFLSAIDTTLCGLDAGASAKYRDTEVGDYLYFGAGYWRGHVRRWGTMLGVRLENPDYTGAEIAQVEQGVALIRRFGYVPGPAGLDKS